MAGRNVSGADHPRGVFECQSNTRMPAHALNTDVTISCHPPPRITHDDLWRMLKRTKIARRSLRRCGSIQNGTLNPFLQLDCCPLTKRSIQEALRHFFQPTKTGDPRVDFYTMYKRESAEYDADYIRKYDEDLNTTLIFVRCSPFCLVNYLIYCCRPACSPPSAPPLSSTSIRISSLIPTNNPPPSSAPFSSLSTNLPFPARPPLFHPFRRAQRVKSSPRRV